MKKRRNNYENYGQGFVQEVMKKLRNNMEKLRARFLYRGNEETTENDEKTAEKLRKIAGKVSFKRWWRIYEITWKKYEKIRARFL